MWSNDIKCKCMCLFPLKNFASKGLGLKSFSWHDVVMHCIQSIMFKYCLCNSVIYSTHGLMAKWPIVFFNRIRSLTLIKMAPFIKEVCALYVKVVLVQAIIDTAGCVYKAGHYKMSTFELMSVFLNLYMVTCLRCLVYLVELSELFWQVQIEVPLSLFSNKNSLRFPVTRRVD